MPAKSLTTFCDVGVDILSTSLGEAKNVILAQTGDSVNQDVKCDQAEWWQHVGFASRPSLAEAGKSACQALALDEADVDICFASRDNRVAEIYGELGPGETALYAAGPNVSGKGTGRVFLKDDGSISTVSILTQKDNSDSGAPVIIQVSSEEKIFINAGENGAITIDQDGIKLASNSKIQLGGSGDMTLIGQSLTLNGANVSLGANATDTVAKSTDLLVYIGYLETMLLSFKNALASGSFVVTPNPALTALIASLAAFDPITNPTIIDTINGIPSTSVFTA